MYKRIAGFGWLKMALRRAQDGPGNGWGPLEGPLGTTPKWPSWDPCLLRPQEGHFGVVPSGPSSGPQPFPCGTKNHQKTIGILQFWPLFGVPTSSCKEKSA